jgi:hypothetical protein
VIKGSVVRFGPSSLLALFLLAPFAFAQNATINFNGNSQGTAWCGGSAGCTATGFYGGSINNLAVGPSQAGGPGFVSDDYMKMSKGSTWTANGINVAQLNSGNIQGQSLFGSSVGMNGYAEMAFLVNQMFGSSPNAGTQSAYSQALWYITSNGKLSYSSLSLSAKVLVLAAAAYVQSHGSSLSQYANLWLYAPTGSGAGEVWGRVAVAEGGAALMYLLLAAMACFGAIFFRLRPGRTQQTA